MIPDKPLPTSNSGFFKTELKQLMNDRGIPSLVALSVKAQVSIGAVKRLQKGNLAAMQLQTVAKLAQALSVSIDELVNLGEFRNRTASQPPILGEQEGFQRGVLEILEPWLLQWSGAAYAAQTNPQLTAIKLLPLLRPIETLLTQWGVVPIGAVGEELAYDARLHQSMTGEDLVVGTMVRIRFSGYLYREQILHRAKVMRV